MAEPDGMLSGGVQKMDAAAQEAQEDIDPSCKHPHPQMGCPDCGAWLPRAEPDQQEWKDLKTALFEALGEASMQWNPRPAGVFDSSHCSEIGEKVWAKMWQTIEAQLTAERRHRAPVQQKWTPKTVREIWDANAHDPKGLISKFFADVAAKVNAAIDREVQTSGEPVEPFVCICGRADGPGRAAKFTSAGGGRSIKTAEGKVSVWRGKTNEGEDGIAVKLKHDTGNQFHFLLSVEGTLAVLTLLHGALAAGDKSEVQTSGEPK